MRAPHAHTETLAWAGRGPFWLGQHISRVWDRVQPGRPSQCWTDGEGVFFRVDSSPFAPAGNLTCLRSAVQSKKALLAVFLNEDGKASFGRAAQFVKALTLMV